MRAITSSSPHAVGYGAHLDEEPTGCVCDAQDVVPRTRVSRSVQTLHSRDASSSDPLRLGTARERLLLGSRLPGRGCGDLVASPPTHRSRVRRSQVSARSPPRQRLGGSPPDVVPHNRITANVIRITANINRITANVNRITGAPGCGRRSF